MQQYILNQPLPNSFKDYSYLNSDSMPKADGQACSAFTVAELGEMLPCFDGRITMPWHNEDGWRSHYCQEPLTEADARAKMLIHLIDKGVIKP